MAAKGTGLRKRSQISHANRTMFIWVASMSAIVMVCVVVAYHLVHTVIFNGRVIATKAQTIKHLKTSNNNIDELKSQVLALDANELLMALRTNEEDKAIQVVLDALPSSPNPLSFGASLQRVLLVGPPGINIKSILVDSTDGALVADDQAMQDNSEADSVEESSTNDDSSGLDSTGAIPINFSFVVEGPEHSLEEVLQRLEESIRTVYVDSVSIERVGSENEMSVSGHVFYQPQKTADLKKKVIK